jgi:hypothetical protein
MNLPKRGDRKTRKSAAADENVTPRWAWWRRCALAVIGLAATAGLVMGARRLEQQVHAEVALRQRPQFRLIGAPPGLDERIAAQLAAMDDLVWIDPALCQRIADVLAGDAWVKRVRSVRKTIVPVVEICCEYRTPVAMVAGRDEPIADGRSSSDGLFFLVDADRVRLPGQFGYHPSLLVVRGVAGAPPISGNVWTAPELAAALAIAQPLEGEPYRRQIIGIGVRNYHGRVDRRAPQIELLTDRPEGRIVWGSAPGEEIEENSAAQKLAILRANHASKGRADAGLRVIDISTLPGRFTTLSRSEPRPSEPRP